MLKGILIPVNGPAVVHEVDGKLESLQQVVGGYIECVCLGETGFSGYVNEDGIALGLPFNRKATALCQRLEAGLQTNDYIKGPMLVLGPVDEEGAETSLTKDQTKKILGLIG